MADKIIIEIITNPRPTVARGLIIFGFIVLYVVAAKLIGSAAMEWLSLVIAATGILVFAHMDDRKNKGLTIAQARARLDEIAGEGASHDG